MFLFNGNLCQEYVNFSQHKILQPAPSVSLLNTGGQVVNLSNISGYFHNKYTEIYKVQKGI